MIIFLIIFLIIALCIPSLINLVITDIYLLCVLFLILFLIISMVTIRLDNKPSEDLTTILQKRDTATYGHYSPSYSLMENK